MEIIKNPRVFGRGVRQLNIRKGEIGEFVPARRSGGDCWFERKGMTARLVRWAYESNNFGFHIGCLNLEIISRDSFERYFLGSAKNSECLSWLRFPSPSRCKVNVNRAVRIGLEAWRL